MQVPISSKEYQRLELIPNSDSGPNSGPDSGSDSGSNLGSTHSQNWLSRWKNAVLAYLNGSSEPQVWQVHRNGQTAWRVYDPISRHQAEFTSEMELRIWLEERYYQPVWG